MLNLRHPRRLLSIKHAPVRDLRHGNEAGREQNGACPPGQRKPAIASTAASTWSGIVTMLVPNRTYW
jgi:hypothetical protein